MQSGAHGRQWHHAQVFAPFTLPRAARANSVAGNSARPITRRFLICPAMNSMTTSGAQSNLRSSFFFLLLPSSALVLPLPATRALLSSSMLVPQTTCAGPGCRRAPQGTGAGQSAAQCSACAYAETLCAQGGVAVGDIDALVVCTCTGYICPGVSSYLSQLLGIKVRFALLFPGLIFVGISTALLAVCIHAGSCGSRLWSCDSLAASRQVFTGSRCYTVHAFLCPT